jgi:hypothetical protein
MHDPHLVAASDAVLLRLPKQPIGNPKETPKTPETPRVMSLAQVLEQACTTAETSWDPVNGAVHAYGGGGELMAFCKRLEVERDAMRAENQPVDLMEGFIRALRLILAEELEE